MGVHSMLELKQFQAMPLEVKVAMSKVRIRDWVNHYGKDSVYVSFSGGKDSTVLLHIIREEYPDIPAVFIDTGLEYPEVRQFVKTFDNVIFLKPPMNFRKVIEVYGYPIISKEVSHKIHDLNVSHSRGRESYVDRQLNGTYVSKAGNKNMVSIEKYKFLIDAPFKISHKCCDVMKKIPSKKFETETGRRPFIGTLAEESLLRTRSWCLFGCNSFETKREMSRPLSFWTEQDILHYIKNNNIKLCSVYGDIVPDYGNEIAGQLDLSDFGIAKDNKQLKTSGCSRTGCMFCGFGCHLETKGEGRFEKMKVNYPTIYDYIMRPISEGGLNFKEVFEWLNEHGDLNIRF